MAAQHRQERRGGPTGEHRRVVQRRDQQRQVGLELCTLALIEFFCVCVSQRPPETVGVANAEGSVSETATEETTTGAEDSSGM